MIRSHPREILYKPILRDKLNMFKNSLQASHCMVYAINEGKIKLDYEEYSAKANVLMHLRYDGSIGFPGGYVDEGENAEEAVVREMKEEIPNDTKCLDINAEIDMHNCLFLLKDHVISHYSSEKKLLVHLYAKEVSLSLFAELEQSSLKGYDYGVEVMGVMRIPLYTMADNFGGFPSFLQNQFIGNSKQQLRYALVAREIMTEEEVNKALTTSFC